MAAFSPQPRKPSEGGKLLLAAVCSNLLWATTEISIISRGDGTGKVWSFLVEGKRLLGSERAMLNQTPSTSVELKTWATFQLQKSISRRRKFSRSNHRGIKLTSFFTRNVISFSIFFFVFFLSGCNRFANQPATYFLCFPISNQSDFPEASSSARFLRFHLGNTKIQ